MFHLINKGFKMKKMLLTLGVIAMIATSAFGVEGKVTLVNINADGIIKVTVGDASRSLVGTPDAIKAMFAASLTAKTADFTVRGKTGTTSGGDYGWRVIELQ